MTGFGPSLGLTLALAAAPMPAVAGTCDAEARAFDEASRVLSGAFFGDTPEPGGFLDTLAGLRLRYGSDPVELAWREREAVDGEIVLAQRHRRDPSLAVPADDQMRAFLQTAFDFQACRSPDLATLDSERAERVAYGDRQLADYARLHFGLDLTTGQGQ